MSAALHEGEISVLKQRERWRPGSHEKQPEVQCLDGTLLSHKTNLNTVFLTPAVRICGVRADWKREKINFRLPFFHARTSTFPLLKFPITYQTYQWNSLRVYCSPLNMSKGIWNFHDLKLKKLQDERYICEKNVTYMFRLCNHHLLLLFILLLKPALKVFCCKPKYRASIIHYLIFVLSSLYFFLAVFLS